MAAGASFMTPPPPPAYTFTPRGRGRHVGSGAGVALGPHPLRSRLRGPRSHRSAGVSEPGPSPRSTQAQFPPASYWGGRGIAGCGRRSGSEQRLSPALLPALRRCLRVRIPRVWAAARARQRAFPAPYCAAAHLRGLASCGCQVSHRALPRSRFSLFSL